MKSHNSPFEIFAEQPESLTLSESKECGFYFEESFLDRCKAWIGNRNFTDFASVSSEVYPVAILRHPDVTDEAMIVTTGYHSFHETLKTQNIQTELEAKLGVRLTHIAEADPNEIGAIIDDATEKLIIKENGGAKKSLTAELQLLTKLVSDAIKENGSDIHWYVTKETATAVVRADGVFVMRKTYAPTTARRIVTASLYSNSKDYSSISDDNEMVDTEIELDIQVEDGSGKFVTELITLRTSKSAGVDGPHTVMRLIRNGKDSHPHINELGLDKDILRRVKDAISSPSGIILFTGPTGSGKSTGLAALAESIEEDRKIITLEDPVEYKLHRTNTVQMSVKRNQPGRGYIDYLEKAMRQDPDVLIISEMRTAEVMKVVITSAMTGHLMISTLHSNDAIGAISRLVDEGISPAVLAERNLFKSIVAQRLIPLLCPHCKVQSYSKELNMSVYVRSDGGCEKCKGKGLQGRVLVAEDIAIDDGCREHIRKYDLVGLEEHIRSNGWQSLADRTLMHIANGTIDPYIAQSYVTNLLGQTSEVTYGDVELCAYKGLPDTAKEELQKEKRVAEYE